MQMSPISVVSYLRRCLQASKWETHLFYIHVCWVSIKELFVYKPISILSLSFKAIFTTVKTRI